MGIFSAIKASGGKGLTGALNIAGVGMTTAVSLDTRSQDYGTGGAAAIGITEGMMYLPFGIAGSMALMAAHIGLPALYEKGLSTYKQNRRLNIGKPMDDTFGNLATMRQRSAQSLQRGRAILGSEARLMR